MGPAKPCEDPPRLVGFRLVYVGRMKPPDWFECAKQVTQTACGLPEGALRNEGQSGRYRGAVGSLSRDERNALDIVRNGTGRGPIPAPGGAYFLRLVGAIFSTLGMH